MIRGLYTAATGMAVQREKMDIVTNNIVNAETTGYKADTMFTQNFNAVMLERINDPNVNIIGTDVGRYSFGSHITEKLTNFSQGSLEETNRPTDIAIDGEGFFVIETLDGERYTKAGNFTVNREGYLITQDGDYVLGDNGRIMVGAGDFRIDFNGNVTGDGVPVNSIRIVRAEDPTALRKQGDSLYYLYGGAAMVDDNASVVRQGFQENSNVNIADELVEMITLYREYEASQRAVIMNDETLGMAVNKLGRLG
ncbi:MAG: flagellar hook-basal body complex protein [Ruminococcaceae bacterium]|nr:flagellar hook-basal body complex protein [Oscillospiraceae bacterium]